MNTSQLECFVRVAETLNFQQTAEALHISQPAVSKQIASLEDELGSRLFVRTTRTVALTAAGEMFLPDARNILRLTYHARQMVSESKQNIGHTLRIGYSDTNELVCLSGVFRRLRERYPDFKPLLVHNKWDASISQLENGQLDVCFGLEDGRRHSKVRFQVLSDQPLVCLLHRSHPLSDHSFLYSEQMRGEQEVRVIPLVMRNRFYNTDRSMVFPTGDDQERITLCDNTAEAYSLVLSGFGYCLIPKYLAAPNEELRVIDCDLRWEMNHGVYYQEDGASQLLREFLQLLREACT